MDTRSPQLLEALYKDLLKFIFTKLDNRSLAQLAQTNKYLHEVVEETPTYQQTTLQKTYSTYGVLRQRLNANKILTDEIAMKVLPDAPEPAQDSLASSCGDAAITMGIGCVFPGIPTTLALVIALKTPYALLALPGGGLLLYALSCLCPGFICGEDRDTARLESGFRMRM